MISFFGYYYFFSFSFLLPFLLLIYSYAGTQILGSDLVYSLAAGERLPAAIERLLSPGGVFVGVFAFYRVVSQFSIFALVSFLEKIYDNSISDSLLFLPPGSCGISAGIYVLIVNGFCHTHTLTFAGRGEIVSNSSNMVSSSAIVHIITGC